MTGVQIRITHIRGLAGKVTAYPAEKAAREVDAAAAP